jgi:hypothetical protein
MPTYEAVKTEVKTMRKAKNDKATTPKAPKAPKTKVTDADLLADAIAFIASLEITEATSGLLAELEATVSAKVDAYNEALV